MVQKEVQIEQSWKEVLKEEFEKEYFQNIKNQLRSMKVQGREIYPPGKLIFNAFNTTPFDKVKVIILGQDPYHNPGEAMGLSFSVPKGIKIPPSLKNIFKEISDDIGCSIPNHGDLSYWAEQGVFLLNTILTVEKNLASSHKNIGWQYFTDSIIRHLSDKKEYLVFMLWGNFAKQKEVLIDRVKHLVLSSPHPSPLAGGGFFGNHHFSQANEYLLRHNIKPIDWQIK